MIRSSVILCGVATALACISALAQPAATNPPPAAGTPKPKTDTPTPPTPRVDAPKPDPKGEAKPKPAPEAKPVAYPPTPPKKLYAGNDFRGKKAPKIEIEEWLSPQADWTGKTLLVDFWATWCKPCRDLMPELEQWQEKYKADLVVVGLTGESKKVVDNFVDLRGAEVKYPMARDGQSRTNKEIGIQGIPHVLVISSDGIVRWQGFPSSDEDTLTEATLRQIIDADKAARATRPPKPAEPKPEEKKPDGK
jgi:thiol-disulfide isomerase/thioredoxin